MAMSFDTRNNSALMKRAEQLRRWEESDTNREPSVPKNEKGRRIKFSSGCVFLAACVAGDKDEVIRLLESGADINTANVDGLTALHQACIDDNLEMVEFLIEHGADINRQDNEGWTPLHATASCGFVSIARYLVENGADLTAINSDGELAIDLASTNAMADYLQNLYDELGIDCENARQIEEQTMLNDAKKWLKSDASEADKPHPKTGATALHVAAAKGYTKVLGLLLAGRANVDKQDNDGWTPLHAAAHWGQKEAAEMLIDAMADIDIKNYAGQTPIDVAEPKIVRFLEELKANNKRAKRRPSSQIRISDTIENHIETPTKLIRVEVKSDSKDSTTTTTANTTTTTTTTTTKPAINEDTNNSLEKIMESEETETDSDLTDSTESSHSTSVSDNDKRLDEKPKPPTEPAKPPPEIVEEDAPWRRNSSLRARSQQESPPKSQVPDKDVKSTDSEVILRRTQSFENDEKFYQKYHELRARIKANSCPILPATQTTGVISAVNTPNNYSVQRSASLKDHRHIRKPISPPVSPNTPATTTFFRSNNITNDINNDNNNQKTPPVTINKNEIKTNDSGGSLRSKISPGNIFKNFFKSFVPPVRDEESETQRKAHAKRVRETRRSTQGVTLDEIKSAEELVKKKNLSNNNNNSNSNNNNSSNNSNSNTNNNSTSNNDTQNITSSITTSTTTTTTTIITSTITTTNNTTSTTASIPGTINSVLKSGINDRVPSTLTDEIGSSDNLTGQITTTTTTATTTTTTTPTTTTNQSNQNEVSASYTITAPSNRFRDLSPTNKSDMKNNKMSATYTISPSSVVTVTTTATTTTPSLQISSSNIIQTPSINDDKNLTEANISATINVPITNNKKTENMEELTKTASSTVIVTGDNTDDNNRTNIITVEGGKNTNLRNTPSPTMPTTIELETNRVRDKRSLFDIDNANSLTLAEKLRNEANKYNEVSRSNNDITTFGINKSSLTAVTDDNEKENSINRKCDSSPSSPLHHGHGSTTGTMTTTTTTTTTTTVTTERRPSWRLKFDAGSKFKLEDASAGTTSFPPSNSTIITSAPAVIAAASLSSMAQRRTSNSVNATSQTPRPVSAPSSISSSTGNDNSSNDRINRDIISSTTTPITATATVTPTNTSSDITVTLRRNKNSEDKENDKENDSRSAQATQAVIQRRRRPKRRSTGVVHLDMDDIDPDKQDSPGDNEEKESGSERASRSRLGSTSSLAVDTEQINDKASGNKESSENGEFIDYKALWEAVKLENEKLKQQLKKKDDELTTAKAAIDRFTNATTKNSLSELEKRERRAMERKLSEMEEELKQMDILKTENQRLKEENGALIRVISKLSK